MQQVPFYLPVIFILTVLMTLFFLYRGTGRSAAFTMIVFILALIQSVVGLSGFFTYTNSNPPRFALLLAIPLLIMLILFITPRGRTMIDRFDPKWLTWLHIVRIPVELTLLGLFLHGKIPGIMTFEGRNLDIISGLTAPLIIWLGYQQRKLPKIFLITWNLACLALLVNILIIAVLTLPTPFQQLAFDQPNVGVLYFPFVMLPGIVVPAVLLSHLVCLRALWKEMTAARSQQRCI
jgi:heme/copper-type cytochrome/quinol oxidase subunit 4